MSTSAPNHQWKEGGDFLHGDRGTMALGVKEAPVLPPSTFVPISEDFEDDTFNVTITGDWVRSNAAAHGGTWSFGSPDIDNGQSADAVVTVPSGATHVQFWYKVSSEAGFDEFRVIINSVVVLEASGEIDWTQSAALALDGATDVTFRYIKDSSVTEGTDEAFIDDLIFSEVIFEPDGIYVPLRLDASGNLFVTATDFDIRVLDCETDSITVCPPEDDAPFHVIVDNSLPVSGTFTQAPLTCETDSVTVCPPDDDAPFHVIVDNTFPVSGTFTQEPLTCETDSVTVCPPDDDAPFHVIVDSSPPVSSVPLSCETDSVTVCPSGIFPVSGIGPFEICASEPIPVCVALDCSTDSVTICPSGVIPVSGIGPFEVFTVDSNTLSTDSTRITVDDPGLILLPASAIRKRFFIQNVGTTIIYLGLGAIAPTLTTYYLALPPGTVTDDGKGGTYIDELWTGEVQAISSVDGGEVVVTELS
jgi:hypothetical protein